MPTIAELGAKVKARYPGQYDDMDDLSLGQKVKAKYPTEYADFTDIDPTATQPQAGQKLATRQSVGRNAMTDFGRLTSTGGIGGMGGIEENPGMGMMTPEQRGGVRANALSNAAINVAVPLAGMGVGGMARSPLGRAAGAMIADAPVVGRVVRGAGAGIEAFRKAASERAVAAAARAAARPSAAAARAQAQAATRAEIAAAQAQRTTQMPARGPVPPSSPAVSQHVAQRVAQAESRRVAQEQATAQAAKAAGEAARAEARAAQAARAKAQEAAQNAKRMAKEAAEAERSAARAKAIARTSARPTRIAPKPTPQPAQQPAPKPYKPRGASGPELERRAAARAAAVGRPPAMGGNVAGQLENSIASAQRFPGLSSQQHQLLYLLRILSDPTSEEAQMLSRVLFGP